MNIEGIKTSLTGENLLSITYEFLNIEGLDIQDIVICEEDIKIYGSYTKGIKLDFSVGVKVNRVENGIIHGDITYFKVAKIKIASVIRKIALKFILKSLEEKGIGYSNGKVVVNIKEILRDVPYVDFDISNIYLAKNHLNVELSNLKVSIKGTLIKDKPKEEEEEKEEDFEKISENIEKVTDSYTTGRNYIKEKLPVSAKKYSDYLFVIPDIAALLYRLLKDKRVDLKTKLIISAAISYIAFPTDIIPDKIPFIGKIDEIAVAFFALDKIISDVPMNIILENWQGKNDLVLVLKNILEYAVNFTGANNVDRIYNFINELVTI